MGHLTVLGPIPSGDGPSYAALRFRDGAPDATFGRDAEEAARKALSRGAGEVVVDARHGALAATLGLPTAPLPPEVARTVAALALGLSNPGGLAKITDPELLLELLDATAAFARAEPWRSFDPDVGVPARASGVLGGERELAVLGARGEQLGLVVYPVAGLAARLAGTPPEEWQARLFEHEVLIVYLDREPAWALAVLEAAGLPFAPLLRNVDHGRPAPLRADHVRLLAASLRAVAAVVETKGPATGRCAYRGKTVEVAVEPGEGFDPAGQASPSPLHALDAAVVAKLLAHARTVPGFSEAWLAEGALAAAPRLAPPISLFARPLGGETIAARALAAGVLDEDEAAWARAQSAARTTLLEVEASEGESRLALRDLLGGDAGIFHDVGLARTATPGTVLVARAVSHRGEHVLAGSLERALRPGEAADVRAALLAEGELPGPVRSLRLVELATRPPPGGGALRTTDGDPALQVTERFELPGGRGLDALAAAPDVERDGPDAFVLTKRGNALHPSWFRTSVGSVTAKGRTLTVETMSARRADDARARLEAALGPGLRSLGRTERPLPAPPHLPPEGVSFDAQPMTPGPWMGLLADLDRLVDLRGRLSSPPTEAELADVDARLAEGEVALAAHGDPLAEHGDRVPLDLRRLLGVARGGRFLGPDRAYASLGAGVPISLALASLAAPVREELDVGDAQLFRWIAALWNASREGARRDEAIDGALGARAGEPRSRDVAGFVFDLARSLFGHDERRVGEVEVTRAGAIRASAGLPALPGVRRGEEPERPVVRYEPEEELDEVAWELVPPPWRMELVKDGHRYGPLPREGTFEAFAARVLAIEEAVLAGKPEVLAESLEAVADALDSRTEALAAIAEALAEAPEVAPGKASKALAARLERVVEEVGG